MAKLSMALPARLTFVASFKNVGVSGSPRRHPRRKSVSALPANAPHASNSTPLKRSSHDVQEREALNRIIVREKQWRLRRQDAPRTFFVPG